MPVPHLEIPLYPSSPRCRLPGLRPVRGHGLPGGEAGDVLLQVLTAVAGGAGVLQAPDAQGLRIRGRGDS